MHSFPPLKMTMELQWNGDTHATHSLLCQGFLRKVETASHLVVMGMCPGRFTVQGMLLANMPEGSNPCSILASDQHWQD